MPPIATASITKIKEVGRRSGEIIFPPKSTTPVTTTNIAIEKIAIPMNLLDVRPLLHLYLTFKCFKDSQIVIINPIFVAKSGPYTLNNWIIGNWNANLIMIPKTKYFIASPFSDKPCKIAIKTVKSPRLIAVKDDKYKTFEPNGS